MIDKIVVQIWSYGLIEIAHGLRHIEHVLFAVGVLFIVCIGSGDDEVETSCKLFLVILVF